MNTKNCEQCGNSFSYEPPVGYPDKRKYCDSCSQARKEAWEAKTKNVPAQQTIVQTGTSEPVTRHEIVIQRTEKPNSYEFGAKGNRFKIYYEDIQDLKEHIAEIRASGLLDSQEATE